MRYLFAFLWTKHKNLSWYLILLNMLHFREAFLIYTDALYYESAAVIRFLHQDSYLYFSAMREQ